MENNHLFIYIWQTLHILSHFILVTLPSFIYRMSRKSRQGYSIRHLLQLPNAPRSPPASSHPPAPCIKVSAILQLFNLTVSFMVEQFKC